MFVLLKKALLTSARYSRADDQTPVMKEFNRTENLSQGALTNEIYIKLIKDEIQKKKHSEFWLQQLI